MPLALAPSSFPVSSCAFPFPSRPNHPRAPQKENPVNRCCVARTGKILFSCALLLFSQTFFFPASSSSFSFFQISTDRLGDFPPAGIATKTMISANCLFNPYIYGKWYENLRKIGSRDCLTIVLQRYWKIECQSGI